MKRKFGGRLSAMASEVEDVNPMDGVANLADVMLVLACGLMLALVINWNVDIATKSGADAPQPTEQIQEMEITGGESEEIQADAALVDVGRVYRDPATGKLYLVADSADASD